MANLGSFDFSQLKELQNRLNGLADVNGFINDCAKEIAARVLAKVIERTPVGDYPSSSGKVGGTLRRGWTGEVETDAGAYADSLPITQSGNTLYIEIANPVEYASYVEYGHRTRGGKGWVDGKFMLKLAVDEVQQITQPLLEDKIKEFLNGVFT